MMINWSRNLSNQQIDTNPVENTSYFIFDLSLPFDECYHDPQHVRKNRKITLPVYIRTTTFDQEIAYTWLLNQKQQEFLRDTAYEKGSSSSLSSFIAAVRANNMKEAQSTLINFVSTDDWFYHAYYAYLEKEITLTQLISIQSWAAAVTQFGKDNFILTKIHDFFKVKYETQSSFLNNKEYKKTNDNDWAEDLIAYSPSTSAYNQSYQLQDFFPGKNTALSMIKMTGNVYFIMPSEFLQEVMLKQSLQNPQHSITMSYLLSTTPDLPHEIFPGFQSLNKRPGLAVLPENISKMLSQFDTNANTDWNPYSEYYSHLINLGPWGYMHHDYRHAAMLTNPDNIYLANLITNVYACINQLHEHFKFTVSHQAQIDSDIKRCIDNPDREKLLLSKIMNYTLYTAHKIVLCLKSKNDTVELSTTGLSSQIIYYSDEKHFYITRKSQQGDQLEILSLSSKKRFGATDFIQDRYDYLSQILKEKSYDDLMNDNYLLSEVHATAFLGNHYHEWREEIPGKEFTLHAQILLYCHLKSTQADAAQWDRIADKSRSIPTLAEMEQLPAIKHYHESPGKYNKLYAKTSLSCKNAIIGTTQHEVSHDKTSLHKF